MSEEIELVIFNGMFCFAMTTFCFLLFLSLLKSIGLTHALNFTGINICYSVSVPIYAT